MTTECVFVDSSQPSRTNTQDLHSTNAENTVYDEINHHDYQYITQCDEAVQHSPTVCYANHQQAYGIAHDWNYHAEDCNQPKIIAFRELGSYATLRKESGVAASVNSYTPLETGTHSDKGADNSSSVKRGSSDEPSIRTSNQTSYDSSAEATEPGVYLSLTRHEEESNEVENGTSRCGIGDARDGCGTEKKFVTGMKMSYCIEQLPSVVQCSECSDCSRNDYLTLLSD